MLASWNRHDSREIFTSGAHVPEMAAEKARCEAAGSEVREVGEGSWRIFLKGETVPGLTMSRAFGDFMLGSIGPANLGVCQTPEYKLMTMQPGDEWYAVGTPSILVNTFSTMGREAFPQGLWTVRKTQRGLVEHGPSSMAATMAMVDNGISRRI